MKLSNSNKKLFFFIFSLILFSSFVLAQDFGVDDKNIPRLEFINDTITIVNGSNLNVNTSEIWLASECPGGQCDDVSDLEPYLNGVYGQLADNNYWSGSNNFESLNINNTNFTATDSQGNRVDFLFGAGFPTNIFYRFPLFDAELAALNVLQIWTAQQSFPSISVSDLISLSGNFSQTGTSFTSSALNVIFSGDLLSIGKDLCHDGDPNTCLTYTADQIEGTAGGQDWLNVDETNAEDLIQLGQEDYNLYLGSSAGNRNGTLLGRVFAPNLTQSIASQYVCRNPTTGELIANSSYCGNAPGDDGLVIREMSVVNNEAIGTFKDGFPVSLQSSGGATGWSFRVPSDYNSSINASFLIIGNADGSESFDLAVSHAQPGQLYTANTNISSHSIATTTNTLTEFSLMPYFTNFTAGEWVGVKLSATSSTVDISSFYWRYYANEN